MTAPEPAQWPIKSVAYRANLCHVSLGASILIKALHVLHASLLNVARTDVTTQRVYYRGRASGWTGWTMSRGQNEPPKQRGKKEKD